MSDKLFGTVKTGTTDVSIPVLLTKTADGTEQTAVVYSSVTASYWRQGGTRTAITMAALTNVNDAHSDGGWKEVDSTNQPGIYRFDVPDAAFAVGAEWVIVSLKVASTFVYHERFNLESAGGAENFARLGAPSGASIAADIAAIPAAVWAVGTRTLTGFGSLVSDIWAAAVDSGGVTTLLGRLSALRASYLDKLNVTGTLANTDNADTFKADVSNLSTLDATAVQTASEAALSAYDAATGTDVTNAQTALTTAIEGIEAGSGGLTDNQASQLGFVYTSVQGGTVNALERISIGNTIRIYRGDRMIVPFEDIGDVSDGRQIWLTMKKDPVTETDAQAVIQITRVGGLVRFMGAAADNAAHGTIEFDDEAAGTGRFILNEQKTTLLTEPKTIYDIQVLDPDEGPKTIVSGDALLSTSTDVTRAIA